MRCRDCGREVALNRTCPYCGSRDIEEPEFDGKKDTHAKGKFYGKRRGSRSGMSGSWWLRLLYFLGNEHVPGWKKITVLGAIFYIFSPIDLLPGALIPIVGWLDDIVVAGFLWRFLNRHMDLADKESVK